MELSDKQIEYAQLRAVGELTDMQCADQIGVARETLWAWRQIPEVQAKIAEYRDFVVTEARGRLKTYSEGIVNRAVGIALNQIKDGSVRVEVEIESQRKMIERLLDHVLGDPSTSDEDVNITVGLPRGMTEDDF